jgi:hypothetical protein
MPKLEQIKPYAKAVVGFVTPGVVALVAAVQESSAGGTSVTLAEWVSIAGAMFATGGLVYGVRNAKKTERGYGSGV